MEPSHLPSSRMDGMAPLLAPRSLLERRLDRKRGRSPEDSDRGMFRSRGRPDEPVRHERGRSVVRERAVVPVREDRGRSVVRGRLDGAERGRSDARGLLPREVHDRGKYAARGRSVARHEYHDVDYDTRERDLGLSTRASQVSTRDEAYFGHCGSAPSLKCFVCSEKLGLPRERCMIAPKLMRAHVAAHILSGETTAFACGFCGRDDSRCYSYIDRGSSKHRVVPSSNCPYFYKFQVSAIINPRCKGPVCTNIPVLCPGCRDITYVWKYGMQEHWVHCHQDLIRAGKRVREVCCCRD